MSDEQQQNSDRVSIGGDAVGVNIGSGSYSAEQIAGRDMAIGSIGAPESEEWTTFESKVAELRLIINDAVQKGEVVPDKAKETLTVLDEAEQAVKKAAQGKGLPEEALDKLRQISEFVSDMIESVDPQGVLGRAIPIVALLLQLGMRMLSGR